MVNLDLARLSNSEISLSSGTVTQGMSDGDHTVDQDHRLCTRRGCKKPALDDADYCARCDALIRKYKRDYDKRRRAEWEAAKRCMRCGAEKRKAGRPWCSACVIRLDRIRRGVRGDHTPDQDHQTKSARLAKRLIPWANSPQNEGRLRLRGGKRGAPGHEDLDRRDLADLQRHLARYTESVDEAYGPDYAGMSTVQKEATRRALHAGLAWMARFCAEACKVRGYELPVVEEDEIDDSDDESDS